MAVTEAPPGVRASAPPRSVRTGPPRKRRKKPFSWWVPFVLIAPAVVFELLIHVTPMAVGVWMSFVKLTKFFIANWSAAPFAGWDNYHLALDFNGALGASLLNSFVVTCAFTVIVVCVSWLFGMAGAAVLQRTFRGRAIFRTFFLVPYAIPVYAGVIAWKFMFQRDTGAVNYLLADNLHLIGEAAKPFWLIGNNAFVAVVVATIWRMWPFAFLMLMAGLQSIPEEVYEASAVDGAKPLRQWWSITLPMLGPVNRVLVLVMFLWTFNDFNTPYILFGGAQPPAGDLISFHIYSASFLTLNFGFGAAMSVLLLVFLLLVTGAYLFILNRRSRDA